MNYLEARTLWVHFGLCTAYLDQVCVDIYFHLAIMHTHSSRPVSYGSQLRDVRFERFTILVSILFMHWIIETGKGNSCEFEMTSKIQRCGYSIFEDWVLLYGFQNYIHWSNCRWILLLTERSTRLDSKYLLRWWCQWWRKRIEGRLPQIRT